MHFVSLGCSIVINGRKKEKNLKRDGSMEKREKERCGSNATINEWPISRNLLTNPDSLSQHLMR